MGELVVLDILKVVLLLTGFCALLFLAYVTTRYIGTRQIKAMKSKSISVVETIALGMDKRLHLVKAGKQHILIATTSKTVEFLTMVDLEEPASAEEPEDERETAGRFDFKSIFEKYMLNHQMRQEKNLAGTENGVRREEFGSHSFRSNLERLRSIVQKKAVPAGEKNDENTKEE